MSTLGRNLVVAASVALLVTLTPYAATHAQNRQDRLTPGTMAQFNVSGQPRKAAGEIALPSGSVTVAQTANFLDDYFEGVVSALRQAGRVGPAGFDRGSPRLTGPDGNSLALAYTERQSDRLVPHPKGRNFLTRHDIALALGGRNVRVRKDRFVVAVANPGGASVVGVEIPTAALAAKMPAASMPGGVLLFETNGKVLAYSGKVSSEQIAVFERFVAHQPPNLTVAGVKYTLARARNLDVIVVTRSAKAGLSQTKPTQTRFAKPVVVLSNTDSKVAWLARSAVALPLGLGLLGGVVVFLVRRRRKWVAPYNGFLQGQRGEFLEMRPVDYLDSLSEVRPDPHGEPADREQDKENGQIDAVGRPPADTLQAKTENVFPSSESDRSEIESEPVGAESPELEPQAANGFARGVEPEMGDTSRSELEDPGAQDLAARADRLTRSAQFRERLAEKLESLPAPKTDYEGTDPSGATAGPNIPTYPLRGAARRHRSGSTGEDKTETLRRQKTVQPSEVLITKGEAHLLVEKEADRLVSRMQGWLRDVELRTAEALAVHRDTFRELLEQFEGMQESRERDLASGHDLRNYLANEVASATLKLKQAEAKATEGLLRLKDQVDGLTRKLEGWAGESRISEERFTTALDTIREGWESQIEAHSDLRTEVARLAELFGDAGRKQDTAVDREASERRTAIDQLAFEVKTAHLATENDFSVMTMRIEEFKTVLEALSGRLARTEDLRSRIDALGHRLDRNDSQHVQAVESLHRKVESQFSLDFEQALEHAAHGVVAYQDQLESIMEDNARISARQHQIVQLVASLHAALGKADARATEDLDRLRAQNQELQQMVLTLMRGSRPQGQNLPTDKETPPAKRVPIGPDGRLQPPTPPRFPPPPRGPNQPAPGQSGVAGPAWTESLAPNPVAQVESSATDTQRARLAERRRGPHYEPPPVVDEVPLATPEADPRQMAKSIDLWGRLLGREQKSPGESTSQRKRRPR